jgi:uncharacterized membrane protein YgdD (TMEM256/DUF423 family)
MTNSLALRITGFLGFLAVALGAFGAHGLKEVLAQNGTTAIWEKAVLYHFIHVVMLFLLADRLPLRKGPLFSFLAGIAIFSGSLYLLAYTNLRWLGAITPLGGVSFLVGWLWLALGPRNRDVP